MASGKAASAVGALLQRLPPALRRREVIARIAFFSALVLYVMVHARFVVPEFGEDDQVRFADDAIGWHYTGAARPEDTDYRMRTSPLYVHALKKMLDVGVPIRALPRIMNWANVIISAWLLAGIYLLFRPFVGHAAAVIGCVFFVVSPSAWLGATYGMAHVPAFGFWLAALLVFSWALSEGASRRQFVTGVTVATCLAFLTLSLKADFVLTGLAFPGLALAKRRFTPRNVIAACLIVLIALALQLLYAGSVSAEPVNVRHPHTLAEYLAYWHKRFPFELRAVTDSKNFGAVTNATGPFVFVLTVLALLQHLIDSRTSRLGAWVAAWALPHMVFWAFIYGNSVRHNLCAIPPLLVLVASLVLRITESRPKAAALTAALVVVNYFSDVTGERHGHGTMVPKTNLITLSEEVKFGSGNRRRLAREFAAIPAPKKAAVGRFFLTYALFEVAARGQPQGRLTMKGDDLRLERAGAPTQLVRFKYVGSDAQARTAARQLRRQGFVVWSKDYEL